MLRSVRDKEAHGEWYASFVIHLSESGRIFHTKCNTSRKSKDRHSTSRSTFLEAGPPMHR